MSDAPKKTRWNDDTFTVIEEGKPGEENEIPDEPFDPCSVEEDDA